MLHGSTDAAQQHTCFMLILQTAHNTTMLHLCCAIPQPCGTPIYGHMTMWYTHIWSPPCCTCAVPHLNIVWYTYHTTATSHQAAHRPRNLPGHAKIHSCRATPLNSHRTLHSHIHIKRTHMHIKHSHMHTGRRTFLQVNAFDRYIQQAEDGPAQGCQPCGIPIYGHMTMWYTHIWSYDHVSYEPAQGCQPGLPLRSAQTMNQVRH